MRQAHCRDVHLLVSNRHCWRMGTKRASAIERHQLSGLFSTKTAEWRLGFWREAAGSRARRHGPPKLWHRVDSRGTWEWTSDFAPGVQPAAAAALYAAPATAAGVPPAAPPAVPPAPNGVATALDGHTDSELSDAEFEMRMRACFVEVQAPDTRGQPAPPLSRGVCYAG